MNSGAQAAVNEHITMENAKKGYNYIEKGYVDTGAKTAVDTVAA